MHESTRQGIPSELSSSIQASTISQKVFKRRKAPTLLQRELKLPRRSDTAIQVLCSPSMTRSTCPGQGQGKTWLTERTQANYQDYASNYQHYASNLPLKHTAKVGTSKLVNCESESRLLANRFGLQAERSQGDGELMRNGRQVVEALFFHHG